MADSAKHRRQLCPTQNPHDQDSQAPQADTELNRRKTETDGGRQRRQHRRSAGDEQERKKDRRSGLIQVGARPVIDGRPDPAVSVIGGDQLLQSQLPTPLAVCAEVTAATC